MDNEKDLLKKELETIGEDRVGLEKFKEDTELLGHEDLVALADEKLAALNTQVESMSSQTAANIENAEARGGNSEELNTVIDKDTLLSQQKSDLNSVINELRDLSDRKIKGVESNTELDEKTREKESEKSGIIDNIRELNSKKDQVEVRGEIKEDVEVFEKKAPPRELIKIGSKFNLESKGELVEVEVTSDIKTTNEIHPREYVQVKATEGTLVTEVALNDLIEKKASIEGELVEPEIGDSTKSSIKNFPQQHVEELLLNYNNFGALVSGSTNTAEYMIYKGLVTPDQIATNVQNVIDTFIKRGRKDNDRPEIIRGDLSDNIEEFKNRFKNPQIYDQIMSKVKISI